MEVNPLMVVAVVGVASLLIERVFYYRSLYRRRDNNPSKLENPSHGERLMGLETDVENIKEDIREIKRRLNRK